MSESVESILARYPEVSFIGNKTLESVRSEMLADYKAKYKELTAGISVYRPGGKGGAPQVLLRGLPG